MTARKQREPKPPPFVVYDLQLGFAAAEWMKAKEMDRLATWWLKYRAWQREQRKP